MNTLDDLFVDPQLEATGFWKEVDHPTEGKLRMPDIPPRFSKTKPEITRLQPRLGEHSVEVLQRGWLYAGRNRRHAQVGRDQDGLKAVPTTSRRPIGRRP